MGFMMRVFKQLKDFFGLQKRDEKTLFNEIKRHFTRNGDYVFIGELLRSAYERFGENEALIAPDKSITYKELYFRVINFSKILAQQGVNQHDHVMLWFENSLEFYISYFAIWQLGAVVIPLNTFLHDKELAYIVNEAAPKVFITTKERSERIQTLSLNGLITVDPVMLTDQDIDWQSQVPAVVALEPIPDIKNDKTCLMLFTSGTTGKPKGVMLSSKNVLSNTMQSQARFNVCGVNDGRTQERFFCVLPLFHVFAQNTCVWLPLMSGSSVIIVPKIDRKLITEGLLKNPTIFFGFPALYGLLCMMKTAPLDSIKMFVSGADMLPDKIRAGFGLIYGRKICSGYGLTEASPVVAINYHNEEEPTNVVGHPVIGLECDIRDDEGRSVSQGQIGTLWIKGDNIMLGYYKDPEETAKVLKNGWLNTGDLSSFDSKGMIAVTGRSKDLIIHKGFNIYPQEVENILLTHPAVYKAAVIGKDEEMSGQIPVAYVAVKEHGAHVEKSLRELCSNNLAAYKVPRKFICVDDLPMNATGKVDKKQLDSLT